MDFSNGAQVRQATVADVDFLAPLFDGYRQFYGKPSDEALARAFLLERFQHQQSVLFMAHSSSGEAIGFTQLYPSFSSVLAARTFILGDLFVVPEARGGGVGRRLLEAASEYGRSVGAARLTLSTAVENEAAQALYADHGWVRDTRFLVFHLALS